MQDEVVFPPSLSHLTLSHATTLPIANFPLNLKHLSVTRELLRFFEVDLFPTSLVEMNVILNITSPIDLRKFSVMQRLSITIKRNINSIELPPKLSFLFIHSRENKVNMECIKSPATLTHLILIAEAEATSLPSTLTDLTLGHKFTANLDMLPTSITNLVVGRNFNCNIDKLPQSVTHLELGARFNQKIDKLPTNLVFLSINKDGKSNEGQFDQPVDCLPPQLLYLCLTSKFNQLLDCLPAKLVYLELGESFSQSLSKAPRSLSVIIFGECSCSLIAKTFADQSQSHIKEICNSVMGKLRFFKITYCF